MPGLPVLLSPLYIIGETEITAPWLRAYIPILNLGLLSLISHKLSARYARKAAIVFLITCACVPHYVAFLATAWSEVVAIHLAIIFFLHLDELLDRGRELTGDTAAYWIAALSYTRALYPADNRLLDYHRLQNQRAPERGIQYVVTQGIACLFMFLGLMTPRLVQMSELYGPGYLITSNRMAPLLYHAPDSYIDDAFSNSPWKNEWMAVYDHISKRAHQNDRPFRE